MLTDDRIDALIKRLYKRKSYVLFSLFGPDYLMSNPDKKTEIGRECVKKVFAGKHTTLNNPLKDFFSEDIAVATKKSELVIYLIHHDADLRTLAETKIRELNANRAEPNS